MAPWRAWTRDVLGWMVCGRLSGVKRRSQKRGQWANASLGGSFTSTDEVSTHPPRFPEEKFTRQVMPEKFIIDFRKYGPWVAQYGV